MKTLMRRVLREWERTLLWASVAALSLVTVFLLSRLAAEKAASQVRLPPANRPQSYLNEATAFGFLQPVPTPATSARNPFAFSVRWPKPTAATAAAGPLAGPSVTTTANTEPVTVVVEPAKAIEPDVTVAPPAPPKHTASILYRGLYSGGRDATRQMAFVSTCESPGEVTATAVLAPGQQAAGVTVKRVTPTELVVAGPTGVEISIAVGTQVRIALE